MKMLVFFVEGPDDKRFFESVIFPILEMDFDCIQCYEYASKSKKVVKNFLSALIRMNHSYLFVKDYDRASCYSHLKDKIVAKFDNCSRNCIQIVKREIESWYVAGIPVEFLNKFGINKDDDFNEITKEIFIDQVLKTKVRQDVMIEILNNYKIDLATSRNSSLNYFLGNKIKEIK